MACRHEEIGKLEDDKDKIELAIEKLIAALDKSNCVGDECDMVDSYSKETFMTENMLLLSERLIALNDDGENAISSAISGLKNGLYALEMQLLRYMREDEEYHAAHPDEPIPEESEESA